MIVKRMTASRNQSKGLYQGVTKDPVKACPRSFPKNTPLKYFPPRVYPSRDRKQRGSKPATVVPDAYGSRLVDPPGPNSSANHNSPVLAIEKQCACHQHHAVPVDLAFQGGVPIHQ